MKFRGTVSRDTIRLEFTILTVGELKIIDLRDFDTSTLSLEIKPTPSGIKLIGYWVGPVEKAGEIIVKAVEESKKVKDKILERIRARVESIRSLMASLGFKEEIVEYGSSLRFTKTLGDYTIVLVASTIDDSINVEVYGGDGKAIVPQLELMFDNVDIEQQEIYELDETSEKLVISVSTTEEGEKKIVETIKMLENILMT